MASKDVDEFFEKIRRNSNLNTQVGIKAKTRQESKGKSYEKIYGGSVGRADGVEMPPKSRWFKKIWNGAIDFIIYRPVIAYWIVALNVFGINMAIHMPNQEIVDDMAAAFFGCLFLGALWPLQLIYQLWSLFI